MKWAGAVVSVLLVMVWVGSAWWRVSWVDSQWNYVDLRAGRLAVGCDKRERQSREQLVHLLDLLISFDVMLENQLRAEGFADDDPQITLTIEERKRTEQERADCLAAWRVERLPFNLLLWFDWSVESVRLNVCIPLWANAIAVMAFTAAVWRLDSRSRRRLRADRCPTCNYDRDGISAQSVCPECGAGPSENPKHPP